MNIELWSAFLASVAQTCYFSWLLKLMFLNALFFVLLSFQQRLRTHVCVQYCIFRSCITPLLTAIWFSTSCLNGLEACCGISQRSLFTEQHEQKSAYKTRHPEKTRMLKSKQSVLFQSQTSLFCLVACFGFSHWFCLDIWIHDAANQIKPQINQ